MTPVRIAVIGTGWISQTAFLPAVHAVPSARVTALVTGNPERAGHLAALHNIADVIPYEALETYLASGAADAVYIATPNAQHAEFAIRAARSGCHVLVEKPLATTREECEAMIAACASARVLLMTAYRLHHDPGTVAFLDRIRNGDIGAPRAFISAFAFQAAPDNHRLSAEHWGGPLQDIGVYCLNAARHVFGTNPVEVMALSSHGHDDPRWREVPETTAVTLRFPKGEVAQFTASFGADCVDFCTVLGTKGTLTADHAFRFETNLKARLLRDGHVQDETVAGDFDDFSNMIQYFCDCIQSGTTPCDDGWEGLDDVVILRAIEEAARSGTAQPIDLPRALRSPDRTTARYLPRRKEGLAS